MKKPNITGGEWKARNDYGVSWSVNIGAFSFISTIQNHILEEKLGITEEQAEANAKAISAIHELIDALLEAYKLIDYINDDIYLSKETIEVYSQIEQALIKAGCK